MLFAVRVGTIRLDDSSRDALIHSAASELVRAYTPATSGVPRPELSGASRQAFACALAERAAYGALPVEGAFWTEHLLGLLDRIAAQEWGLA